MTDALDTAERAVGLTEIYADLASKYAQRSGYLIAVCRRVADELEAIGGRRPPIAVLEAIRDLRRAVAECEEPGQ